MQQARGLPLSKDLDDPVKKSGAPINLDIEMETGTGKTYVYIKTIMELHKRYGWSKYIVVVPSIAIREGVKKSFDITAEHFQQLYGTKPRTFIYNSSRLHEVERFSSDAGVQVMIINIQAFNATGKDARRIYEVLDDFQSRKPIDVIAANRPILIIDEPQKIEGDAKKPSKSLEALGQFNALFALRYSATHKIERTKVHRLDAIDAYNQKLVKKIAVRGITVKHLAGSTAYLYVDGLEVGKGTDFPKARVELEVQTKGGPIKRQVKRLSQGMNLHDISGGIEAYKGLFVRDVDANRDIIELSNGDIITAGQVTQDVTDQAKRRIQIREVIRAHLDKERELFAQGIKALSLFFIDEVAKYRDYAASRREGRVRPGVRGGVRGAARRLPRPAGPRRGGRAVPQARRGDPGPDDAPGLLLDRQEDQAARRPRRADARRERGPVRRRRRLRPDPEGQGAAAVVRGAGAVHLVALGAARGLGQPERVRHGHAQEERQHHHAPPGDRPRAAPVGRPARRADGQPRHRARHQRADRRDRRVVHRLRHGAPEGDHRVAVGPAAQGERRLLHRQDHHARRRRDGRAGEGGRPGALQPPDPERLHRRRRHWSPGLQGGPRRPGRSPRRPRRC